MLSNASSAGQCLQHGSLAVSSLSPHFNRAARVCKDHGPYEKTHHFEGLRFKKRTKGGAIRIHAIILESRHILNKDLSYHALCLKHLARGFGLCAHFALRLSSLERASCGSPHPWPGASPRPWPRRLRARQRAAAKRRGLGPLAKLHEITLQTISAKHGCRFAGTFRIPRFSDRSS